MWTTRIREVSPAVMSERTSYISSTNTPTLRCVAVPIQQARTFSFRAPADLGPRIEHALEVLSGLEIEAGERLLHRFTLLALRRWDVISDSTNQSELMRETMELLVRAVEYVEEQRRLDEEFPSRLEPTKEDVEWRSAVLRWTEERWRED